MNIPKQPNVLLISVKEELVGWFLEESALDAPTKKDYDFNHDKVNLVF